MKKKNLNHKGLTLNKNIISSLESQNVTGGNTNSCLIDVDTNCAQTVGCTFTVNCPPQTNGCPTVQCPPSANCPSQFISCSCPNLGIC
ncbi:MAG: hypothetical protein AAF611_01000 [Bacteroidota bacterium]